MAKSIFSFESEDRVESPERLNEYVRVVSPGLWVMISALILVFAAFIAWGFTGRIPETITLKGVVDPSLNYHIDVMVDASQFSGQSLVGQEVSFAFSSGAKGQGTVVNASQTPFSREEMAELLKSDFLNDSLVNADYSYLLDIESEEDLSRCALEIGQVTIITGEVRPIAFLLH